MAPTVRTTGIDYQCCCGGGQGGGLVIPVSTAFASGTGSGGGDGGGTTTTSALGGGATETTSAAATNGIGIATDASGAHADGTGVPSISVVASAPASARRWLRHQVATCRRQPLSATVVPVVAAL